jgi:hypothetical protein
VKKDATVDLTYVNTGLDHGGHSGNRLGEVERDAQVAGEEIGGAEGEHGESLLPIDHRLGKRGDRAVSAGGYDNFRLTGQRSIDAVSEGSFAVGVDGGIEACCNKLFFR